MTYNIKKLRKLNKFVHNKYYTLHYQIIYKTNNILIYKDKNKLQFQIKKLMIRTYINI